MEKKIINRIKSLFQENHQILGLAHVRIFTSSSVNTDSWVDSNLEGILCYIINPFEKSRYLKMYDKICLELVFEHELYHDFDKYYESYNDIFHYFESNSIFIGFKFHSDIEAKLFGKIVKTLNDQKSSLLISRLKEISSIISPDHSCSKDFLSKVKILKNKFFSKYPSMMSDDSYDPPELLTIRRGLLYDMITDFRFDYNQNKFLINKYSVEVRKIFYELDLSKFDFSDNGFILSILKQIIVILEDKIIGKSNSNIPRKKKLKKFYELINPKGYENSEDNSVAYSVSQSICRRNIRSGKFQVKKKADFESIDEFIVNNCKKSASDQKNQKLPIHKKILFDFPKIPEILIKKSKETVYPPENITEALTKILKDFQFRNQILNLDEIHSSENSYFNRNVYKEKETDDDSVHQFLLQDNDSENEWSD